MRTQDASVSRESRLRRLAIRHGYRVVKSRSRTPDAPIYETFGIVDPDLNAWVATAGGDGYGLDLDEIEEWLSDLLD